MFVKICGITTSEQIDKAAELGYDAVGIVLYPKSKRFVSEEKAKHLAAYAEKRIMSVCVSMEFSDVVNVYKYFNFVQVSESVDVENLIFSTAEEPKFTNYKYVIYDASHGKGKFEKLPEWLHKYREKLIIAGGLNAENVGAVIREVKPFGVDVSSGVEDTPGIKNYEKMKKFINEVRR